MNRILLPPSWRSRSQALAGLVILVAALLASCAQSPAPVYPSTPTTSPPTVTTGPTFTVAPLPIATEPAIEAPKETPVNSTSNPPLPSDPTTAGWVQQAMQDLARQLSIPESEIQFIEFEPVTWPDAGLGCPEPGKFYIQVLVEGFRIRLQHDGQTYTYHGSAKQTPFLCKNISGV